MSTEFSSIMTEPAPRLVKAPLWPALAAASAALAALGSIRPGMSSLWYAGAGYLLGALLVPAFTVIFRFGRRTAAQDPFFIPNLRIERFILLVLIVGIVAGIANAWFVATELAKQ